MYVLVLTAHIPTSGSTLSKTTQNFGEFLEAQTQIIGTSETATDPRPVDRLESLRLCYFSTEELLRIFHFTLPHMASSAQKAIERSSNFVWPADVSQKTKYKLIGNSVNIEVVRRLIDYLFEGDTW